MSVWVLIMKSRKQNRKGDEKMYDIEELIKQSIEQRIERILADVKEGDKKFDELRNKKKRLFNKLKEKDILIEYEDLESEEMELLARWVYKIAINDSLDIVKSIVNHTLL